MNNMVKLGYGRIPKKYIMTAEDYNIQINNINTVYKQSYGEGIFGAVGGAISGTGKAMRGTYNVARDGGQVGIHALKKLMALIKKVLQGFMSMIKQIILGLGDQTSKLGPAYSKLLDLANALKKYRSSQDTRNGVFDKPDQEGETISSSASFDMLKKIPPYRNKQTLLNEYVKQLKAFNESYMNDMEKIFKAYSEDNGNGTGGNGNGTGGSTGTGNSNGGANGGNGNGNGNSGGGGSNRIVDAPIADGNPQHITLTDGNNTLTFVTTYNLNAAGWNLQFAVRDMKTLIASGPNNIMAWFVKILVDSYDMDPYTMFALSKNFEEIMARLEGAFLAANDIYRSDRMYFLQPWYERFKRNFRRGQSAVLGLFRNYRYLGINPAQYGQFVAQAFSPAGSFVTVNSNESFNAGKRREENLIRQMTPKKTANIPFEIAYNPQTNTGLIPGTISYMMIILKVLEQLDPMSYFKDKLGRIEKMMNQLDVLMKSTKEEREQARHARNISGKYGMDFSNQNNTIDYNTINQQMSGSARQQFVESFNNIIQEAIEKDLYGFGEFDQNDLRRSQADLLNLESGHNGNISAEDINEDMNFGSVTNYNKSKFYNNGQMKVDLADMNNNYANYACKYLQSFLVQSGNLVFQEGKFYNNMCKIILGTVEDFVTYIQEEYIDDGNEMNGVTQGNNEFGAKIESSANKLAMERHGHTNLDDQAKIQIYQELMSSIDPNDSQRDAKTRVIQQLIDRLNTINGNNNNNNNNNGGGGTTP